MSNHPKITYRSDSTGCVYEMMQRDGTFAIHVVSFDDGLTIDESPVYAYKVPWRETVNAFFDIVTAHINGKGWVA